MKKTFLLLLAALSVFPAFASKNHLHVKFAPYAFQIATSEKDGDDPISSTYGIGADISYQRDLARGLFAEGGFSWNTYTLKDKDPISSLMPYAGIGYCLAVSENWKLLTHVDAGLDWLVYDGETSSSLSIMTGLEAEVKVSEKLSATAGLDATFGFCEKGGTSYVNYRIIPTLGLEASF